MYCIDLKRHCKIRTFVAFVIITYIVIRSLPQNGRFQNVNDTHGISFNSKTYSSETSKNRFVANNTSHAIHYQTLQRLPSFKVSQVSCRSLGDRDEGALRTAEAVQLGWPRWVAGVSQVWFLTHFEMIEIGFKLTRYQ